jgi:hypothetical protein
MSSGPRFAAATTTIATARRYRRGAAFPYETSYDHDHDYNSYRRPAQRLESINIGLNDAEVGLDESYEYNLPAQGQDSQERESSIPNRVKVDRHWGRR